MAGIANRPDKANLIRTGCLSDSFDRSSLRIVAALIALLFGGCNPGPRAPLLRDEAVYHNRTEKMRFVVPDGWRIRARAELPPGTLDQERMLVEYARLTTVPATLQVTAIDLPTDAPVIPREDRGRKYKAAVVDQATVGGLPAERFVFASADAGPGKEVLAVRRGSRVLFFTGSFIAEDHQGRSAFRRAVDSVVWEH